MRCELVEAAVKRLEVGDRLGVSALHGVVDGGPRRVLASRCADLRSGHGQLVDLADMEGVHFDVVGMVGCVGRERQA